jgi:hypothetical protein
MYFFNKYNTRDSSVAQCYGRAAVSSGGVISTPTFDEQIHTFTSSGVFSPNGVTGVAYLIEVLVVAAGGGTGYDVGGGGGGGGVVYSASYQIDGGTTYDVSIGTGGINGANNDVKGADGQNSAFGSTLGIMCAIILTVCVTKSHFIFAHFCVYLLECVNPHSSSQLPCFKI